MARDIDEIPLFNMANVMLTVLKAAAERPISPAECVERLTRILAVAHEDAEPERPTLEDRVRLAFVELAAAALLEEAREGRFGLTARGRIVLEDHPMGVDETVLAEFREFREFLKRHAGQEIESDAVSLDAPSAAAYLDGYGACAAGRPMTENPHPVDAAEHMAWAAGWFEALDESIKSPD
jgi:restriction system protein